MEAEFVNGFPTPEAVRSNREVELHLDAVTAYRFWYPTVSCEGIFNGVRELGIKDNEALACLTAAPGAKGFTPNADTPYAVGSIDLRESPFVIEVPPGPFIGAIDDHHQRWIMDVGIPGVFGARGGKHLLISPDFEGEIPDGYQVGQAESYKILVAIRILPENGDLEGALNRLKEVKIYPYSNKGDSRELSYVNVSNQSADFTSLRWEDNFSFWKVLKKVIDEEPVVEEFKTMYSYLTSLGIEKGKPFNPDSALTEILQNACVEGRNQLLISAYACERPERFAWNDRKWEWIGLGEDVNFEGKSGIDLEARERWFSQAILTSPAMFRRKEGTGSLYWLGLRDEDYHYLDGAKTYKLIVPTPVPAKLFWSVTVYDNETRSMIVTDQKKAALRSLFELRDSKSSQVELYFGPEAPRGKENQWIQTIPGKGWFAYFRIYGPEQNAFNGYWRPGDFEEFIDKDKLH